MSAAAAGADDRGRRHAVIDAPGGLTKSVLRRARLALGTLVDIGAGGGIERAFELLAEIEFELSGFNPGGDIGRFNQLSGGETLRVGPHTAAVLAAAHALTVESRGLFDVAQGTGAWSLHGRELRKDSSSARIDLGGIGKGYAVDRCFEALRAGACWVNAGGDLRVRGIELPVVLRNERSGGVHPWMVLREGALATSWFGRRARSRLSGRVRAAHVSVAAPSCMLADALTKVVARSGRLDHPLLERHGATAWVHQGTASSTPALE
ncbi:MAG TPA: FAD:protein FMN transferase [Myxococcales bacterium]|jgi:thiamine biosynthesis lipoprotein